MPHNDYQPLDPRVDDGRGNAWTLTLLSVFKTEPLLLFSIVIYFAFRLNFTPPLLATPAPGNFAPRISFPPSPHHRCRPMRTGAITPWARDYHDHVTFETVHTIKHVLYLLLLFLQWTPPPSCWFGHTVRQWFFGKRTRPEHHTAGVLVRKTIIIDRQSSEGTRLKRNDYS